MREELANQMDPLCIGGGSIEEVGIDHYTLARSPMRFEAGTPAIAEGIGLGAAVDYLARIDMNEIESYERSMTDLLYRRLNEIPKVKVYGPEAKDRIGIISFNIGNLNPHDVALALDVSANVMVRSGHHCAMPLTKGILYQEAGTIRASTYFYNTKEELETFTNAVREISRVFS